MYLFGWLQGGEAFRQRELRYFSDPKKLASNRSERKYFAGFEDAKTGENGYNVLEYHMRKLFTIFKRLLINGL
jgi:hypothetical protein